MFGAVNVVCRSLYREKTEYRELPVEASIVPVQIDVFQKQDTGSRLIYTAQILVALQLFYLDTLPNERLSDIHRDGCLD